MTPWNRTWFFVAIGCLPIAIGLGILGGAQSAKGYRIDDAVIQGFSNPGCQPIVEMPAGHNIKPEPSAADPCRALYLFRSARSDAGSTSEAYIERMREWQREEIYKFVAAMLFYWFFGAGLLYAAGRIAIWRSNDPVHVLFGMVIIVTAWTSALAIEMSARLMAHAYRNFGADLPGPTFIALGAIQNYVPWILAATLTLLIPFVSLRAPDYFPHVCAAAASVIAITLSLAAFSLLLPVVGSCSFAWPEWPTPYAESSGISEKAPNLALNVDASRVAPVSSCR